MYTFGKHPEGISSIFIFRCLAWELFKAFLLWKIYLSKQQDIRKFRQLQSVVTSAILRPEARRAPRPSVRRRTDTPEAVKGEPCYINSSTIIWDLKCARSPYSFQDGFITLKSAIRISLTLPGNHGCVRCRSSLVVGVACYPQESLGRALVPSAWWKIMFLPCVPSSRRYRALIPFYLLQWWQAGL